MKGKRLELVLLCLIISNAIAHAQSNVYGSLATECDAIFEMMDVRHTNKFHWYRGDFFDRLPTNYWPRSLLELDPKDIAVSRWSITVSITTGDPSHATGILVQRSGNDNWKNVGSAWTNISALQQLRRLHERVFEFRGVETIPRGQQDDASDSSPATGSEPDDR